MHGNIVEWISGELTFYLFAAAYQPFVSDFTQRYLSIPETDDHNLLTKALATAVDVSISYCRFSLVT